MLTEIVLRSQRAGSWCQRQCAISQLTMPTETVLRSQRAGSWCQRQCAISQLTMPTETVLRSSTTRAKWIDSFRTPRHNKRSETRGLHCSLSWLITHRSESRRITRLVTYRILLTNSSRKQCGRSVVCWCTAVMGAMQKDNGILWESCHTTDTMTRC